MPGNLSASVRILVFRNLEKRGESDPDYVMYLVPPKKRDGKGGTGRASAQPARSGADDAKHF